MTRTPTPDELMAKAFNLAFDAGYGPAPHNSKVERAFHQFKKTYHAILQALFEAACLEPPEDTGDKVQESAKHRRQDQRDLIDAVQHLTTAIKDLDDGAFRLEKTISMKITE